MSLKRPSIISVAVETAVKKIVELVLSLRYYLMEKLCTVENSGLDVFSKTAYSKFFIDDYDYMFVRQQYTWDCGIACCAMALNWFHREQKKKLYFPDDHPLLNRLSPLWTIELYCFMKTTNIFCIMCTKCPGISPTHHKIEWYNDNYSEIEFDRVQNCFSTAQRNRWPVLQVSLRH